VKVAKQHTRFSEIAESLAVMIKFADENEDFILAAKLDDARTMAIQRHESATK
jgi:hypothetical protein